jgi:hypothetical protein
MPWCAKARIWRESANRPRDASCRATPRLRKRQGRIPRIGFGLPLRKRNRKFREEIHAGIRLWRVRGFENYLIAYRQQRAGIAIERIIHAKQDYQRVLK